MNYIANWHHSNDRYVSWSDSSVLTPVRMSVGCLYIYAPLFQWILHIKETFFTIVINKHFSRIVIIVYHVPSSGEDRSFLIRPLLN